MSISFSEKLPAGSITQFAGANAPVGWLLMYGQSLAVALYPALFAAIGYTFGGSGANFNVPDARGRVLFGKDNMGGTAANRATTGGGGLDGATLGAVGGGETVTLTEAQMPAHAHRNNAAYATGVGTGGPAGCAYTYSTTSSTGGSGAHSNIPPALIINYIIKT